LLDKQRIPIPEGISRKETEFTQFLKTALTWIRGSSKRMNLWANISAAGVDIRHIRIPKISKKQRKIRPDVWGFSRAESTIGVWETTIERKGFIHVAGQPFTVTECGSGSCSVTLFPAQVQYNAIQAAVRYNHRNLLFMDRSQQRYILAYGGLFNFI